MATVQTNVQERVFRITNWLGVNEAPEGEARLKHGEAAVMRNFQITAGGALRKRPGSLNVAGLMKEYVPLVDNAQRVLLYTDVGNAGAHQMYPRKAVDTVGNVVVEGAAESVSIENAADKVGYYAKADKVYSFAELVTVLAQGAERIPGGAINLGGLVKFAEGIESNLSGTNAMSGDQSVTTRYGLSLESGALAFTGDTTVQGKPTGSTVGWETQNVGGFAEKNGVVYKYHGVKLESYLKGYKWKKYNCTTSVQAYQYWDQTGFYEYERGKLYSHMGFGGYTSYAWNPYSGTFTGFGTYFSLNGGMSGTVYQTGSGSTCKQIVATDNGDGTSDYVSYHNDAVGPYTGYEIVYNVGSYVGDSFASDGERPDASRGYTYVTSYNGYTIMKDSSGKLFAYVKDTSDTTEYSERRYAWYGYPVTAEADRYEWYFNPTYSKSNDADSVVRGIWSGFVNKREVLCAACNGYLWELSNEGGEWSKVACGEIDTANNVHMFGFDEKLYIMNGESYKVWDGESMRDVVGYVPIVLNVATAEGAGETLEQVNKLSAKRRVWYSPDGTAKDYKLPEKDLQSVDSAIDLTTGAAIPFTADLTAGSVSFTAAPANGTNTVEVTYTVKTDFAESVRKMRFAELYNGAQDTRVFVYGDGSNTAFYSGIDHSGKPRADYFPDMNEVAVGDANTPLTAMIRHYNSLMAFKLDSAYSIKYDTLTIADGSTIAGFYLSAVNRDVGNCAYGQAQLVENRPRTLDGRSVIEWRATSTSGNITSDQRNMERVSQRVDSTIRTFDLSKAHAYYDKLAHEYYVIGEDGTALVNNIDADAWYIYTGMNATCVINYNDELYYGTKDGYLRHFSTDYFSDEGADIDCVWESGAMSFGEDYKRKYSAMLWVGIKPEDNGYLGVTAETDEKSDFAEYSFKVTDAAQVPEMNRIKLKAKKFTYYKLIFKSKNADTTATVVSADIRVRSTGYVR